MAEAETGQEKTEKPTPKKLKDARKKGQVARSRELNTMISLLFASLAFLMLGDFMMARLISIFRQDFVLERDWLFDPVKMLEVFGQNALDALLLLTPFFLVMMVSAFVGPLVVGGWNYSLKSMAPKLSKLNPISGLKRVFGPNGLVELLKALAKFILIGAIAILVFQLIKYELVGLGKEPIKQGLMHGADLLFYEFFALTMALMVIAALDVPYQLWSHHKKLKMTKQQIKEESKQTEGNPEVKGRIKQLQREIAQRRMLEDVPTADVIIVNPTHFAVALKYDEDKVRAPKVVAKGLENIALKIREIGSAHEVPLVSAPPLARALFYSTEIGQVIPQGLYVAVAKVLAYVFQMKQVGMDTTLAPDDLEIPEEFQSLSQKNVRFDR